MCCAATASAYGPNRLKVGETVAIQASAAKVWGLIADFWAIQQWHPGIFEYTSQRGNAEGATRVLTVKEAGGLQITEELQKHAAAAMTYKYKLTRALLEILPVTAYSSFLSVKGNRDGTSIVQWRGGYYRAHPNANPAQGLDDEAALKAVTDSYQLASRTSSN